MVGDVGKGLAARTKKAGPEDAVRDEPTRNILQFVGHILTQSAQSATTMGASDVFRRQFGVHGWDVTRDRPQL